MTFVATDRRNTAQPRGATRRGADLDDRFRATPGRVGGGLPLSAATPALISRSCAEGPGALSCRLPTWPLLHRPFTAFDLDLQE